MAEDTARTNIASYIENLSSSRRRLRQEASHELALIAKEDPEVLVGYVDDLIDAMYRPEAQTRWEMLDTLSAIGAIHPEKVADALEPVETSLYDENSATVRLSAFHYLCVVGALTPRKSEVAWALMDGACQCFHGDTEYRDMLKYLMEFVQGDISPEVAKGICSRMEFDAKNGKGYIKAFSSDIYEVAKSRVKR